MPLISTQTSGLPPGFSGGGGQAYTREAQPGELSGVQLNKLLTSSSPFIQNARRRGAEGAQTRLLGNTSIAIGAAERSAIEAAGPFALQQSQAVGTAASENIGYLNQYEISDRANLSAENRAQIAADAQKFSASAAASASKFSAQAQLRAVEAQLSFNGQQADMNRMQQIVMSNLSQDQNLATLAASHDIDLDSIAAQAFYDLQTVGAADNLNVRNMGMSFVMGAYNNYSVMVQDALMGDFDTAAFGRLIQSANNYLENSIAFGTELFGNFPGFEFDFDTYGGG